MLGCYPLKSVKREPISQTRGKEHRKVGEQGAMIARQQKQIGTLTTGLQKVSAQLAAASLSRGGLEASKFATGRIRGGGPAPQVVNNPWKRVRVPRVRTHATLSQDQCRY